VHLIELNDLHSVVYVKVSIISFTRDANLFDFPSLLSFLSCFKNIVSIINIFTVHKCMHIHRLGIH